MIVEISKMHLHNPYFLLIESLTHTNQLSGLLTGIQLATFLLLVQTTGSHVSGLELDLAKRNASTTDTTLAMQLLKRKAHGTLAGSDNTTEMKMIKKRRTKRKDWLIRKCQRKGQACQVYCQGYRQYLECVMVPLLAAHKSIYYQE